MFFCCCFLKSISGATPSAPSADLFSNNSGSPSSADISDNGLGMRGIYAPGRPHQWSHTEGAPKWTNLKAVGGESGQEGGWCLHGDRRGDTGRPLLPTMC